MGGYRTVMGIVSNLIDDLGITVPVAVHLDHGSYEGAFKALDAGFTSIMFDGSHFPFEENLEKTKEVVAACHAKGVSVEAEVGSIGVKKMVLLEQVKLQTLKKVAQLQQQV